MRKRRLVFSDAAIADILDQADWYVMQSGRRLSRRWEKAVDSAITHVLKNPASGTPWTFPDPALQNLRRATISGFPKHLLFCWFDDQEVFVLRVVHGARDLERLFS